jgi:hypothetical protein
LRLESEDSFLTTLISLGSEYFEYWDYLEVSNLTSAGIALFVDNLPFDQLTESIWERITDRLRGSKCNDLKCECYQKASPPRQHSEPSHTPPDANPPKMSPPPSPPAAQKPPVPPFDSQIVREFPEIFAEFRGKCFNILWRGSRDGFGSQEFHGRCDDHANTLTVILDTNGNISGGFTPVEWDSRTHHPYSKADDSQKSFLFTLKNPHNIPARRFALKAEEKWRAIDCDSGCGPHFYGIYVYDNCNTNTNNYTEFGYSYTFFSIKFHAMLKFLDRNVSHIVNHFHQSHLNQIHT